MGKKKSVVLIAVITIVIAVLCALVCVPSFTFPWNTIKSWNPTFLQYDFGAELDGGYYTYYYPQGVISDAQHDNELVGLEEAEKTAKQDLADGKISQVEYDEIKEELDDYVAKYTQVAGVNGLYFSTLEEDFVLQENEDGTWSIREDFQSAFEKATELVKERFEKRNFEHHVVSVVNGYALRVELSKAEKSVASEKGQLNYVSQAMGLFGQVGKFTLQTDGADIDALNEEGVTIKDLIKSISTKTQYDYAYLEIKFTDAGKKAIKEFKSSEATSMDIAIGGTAIGLSISKDQLTDKLVAQIPLAEKSDIRYVKTVEVLLDTAMEYGEFTLADGEGTFAFAEAGDIRSFDPVYNENVKYFVFCTLLAIMLGFMVFTCVKTGGFGIANIYTNLSYFVIVALCFAFITRGVLELTLGSILVFLFVLTIINVIHVWQYNAIKKEFANGKTVQSSVKNGYKKTLWATVDIYAVLALGGIALLLAVGGMYAFALQTLICVLAGAFCNLLWGRIVNFAFLSASKNKYKYFRFVREEDDDE